MNAARTFSRFAAALLGISVGGSAIAADVNDDFSGPLDTGTWDACQMDKRLPVTFSDDLEQAGNRIAHITVDEQSLGVDNCKPPKTSEFALIEPEKIEALSPSLLSFSGKKWVPTKDKPDPYCAPDVVAKSPLLKNGGCMQRQELRLLGSFWENAEVPTEFKFRFRMPATVLDTTNSIRWIVGQWKTEPVAESNPSPFLAQRYDDGILNITIQNRSCRCLVASAPLKDGTVYDWKNGEAKYCQSTAKADESALCDSKIDLTYGKDPVLASPAGKWVEMSYRVQAGQSDKSAIEVYQDGRFILRAVGHFGYDIQDGAKDLFVKFKIGHYRDYIPSTDTIDLDWLKIAPVK